MLKFLYFTIWTSIFYCQHSFQIGIIGVEYTPRICFFKDYSHTIDDIFVCIVCYNYPTIRVSSKIT